MDPARLPELFASLAFFGLMAVCPIVYLLLKHQRAMAEIISGRATMEMHQRLENVERELRELRAQQNESVLRAEGHQGLTQRIT